MSVKSQRERETQTERKKVYDDNNNAKELRRSAVVVSLFSS